MYRILLESSIPIFILLYYITHSYSKTLEYSYEVIEKDPAQSLKALKFAKASQQSSFLEIVFDFASLPGFLLASMSLYLTKRLPSFR